MAGGPLSAVAPQPGTSKRYRAHPVSPYLLRHLTIRRPKHVRAMDLSYIPMARGCVHLAAGMDWASRKVLSWRVSTMKDSAVGTEAVMDGQGCWRCNTRRHHSSLGNTTPDEAYFLILRSPLRVAA